MEQEQKVTLLSLDHALKAAHSIFLQFDKDKSGTLGREELLSLLQACGISVTNDECKSCLHELDRNGDGVWNFPEFMSFVGLIYQHKLQPENSDAQTRQGSKKNKKGKTKPPPPLRKDSKLQ